jgi:Family of unknown function (DUF6111)
MWRVAIEPALLFLSPFIVYIAVQFLRRNSPFATDSWSRATVSTLTLLGLGVAILGVFLFGVSAERHSGAYVPAHIEDGKLVPGKME